MLNLNFELISIIHITTVYNDNIYISVFDLWGFIVHFQGAYVNLEDSKALLLPTCDITNQFSMYLVSIDCF